MPIDLYAPKTLYGVVERYAPVNTFLRDTFFKNVVTFNTKTVEFDMKKGGRALAPFVHPRAGGKVIAPTGYTTKSYTPPMICPEKVTEADQLMDRLPGENPYSGQTPAARALKKLGEDMRELDEMITRREEWMAAQTIFTGQIPVVGEGINEVIDFNFTNSVTLTTDKWSSDSTDILGQLEDWSQTVRKEGMINPNVVVMDSKAAQALVKNKSMKELLDVKNVELAHIAPKDLKNGVKWIGGFPKLNLDFYQYDEWYLDDTDEENPVNRSMVPEGTIAMLSTEARFSRLYAAHTFMDSKSEQWITAVGDRIPDSWIEKNPDRRMISLTSRPLTVPHEVNSWLVAKVL